MCKALPTDGTIEDTFSVIDQYLAERGQSWKQCVGVCTVGTQLLVGETCGLSAHVNAIAPECTSSHCIIHQQALAVKKITN
jgi:hypothetical protein